MNLCASTAWGQKPWEEVAFQSSICGAVSVGVRRAMEQRARMQQECPGPVQAAPARGPSSY